MAVCRDVMPLESTSSPTRSYPQGSRIPAGMSVLAMGLLVALVFCALQRFVA